MVCFYRQALNTARLSCDDPDIHQRVMHGMGTLLGNLDLSVSPPENAVHVYSLIAETTGVSDPFADLKRGSNDFALGLREQTARLIEESSDPLLTATRFAISGNIIDYGVEREVVDEAASLAACLEQNFVIDEFAEFKREFNGAGRKPKVLYLCDNSGEIVFDSLLIKQLLDLGCEVTAAVREKFILNDATPADAHYCDLNELCPVIVNGTGCPGTPLNVCAAEFREQFAAADLILSKGQGNFETLADVRAPIYFLFTVKCPVVARHIAEKRDLASGVITGAGEPVLMKQETP